MHAADLVLRNVRLPERFGSIPSIQQGHPITSNVMRRLAYTLPLRYCLVLIVAVKVDQQARFIGACKSVLVPISAGCVLLAPHPPVWLAPVVPRPSHMFQSIMSFCCFQMLY
jgi:hypothetical protein